MDNEVERKLHRYFTNVVTLKLCNKDKKFAQKTFYGRNVLNMLLKMSLWLSDMSKIIIAEKMNPKDFQLYALIHKINNKFLLNFLKSKCKIVVYEDKVIVDNVNTCSS